MDLEPVVKKLLQERESLVETLAVAQHRLEEIETFLRLCKKFTGLTVPGALDASTAPRQTSPLEFSEPPVESGLLRDRILNTTARILSDGRRRSTRRLVVELHAQGVSVGGVDPATNLSSYLSKAKDRFDSSAKLGGWGLRDQLDLAGSADDLLLPNSPDSSGS